MKPPPFEYHRPGTLDEALEALARAGEDAKVLAGGQSLIPVLNFRLTSPTALVDLNRVAGLDGLEVTPEGGLRIGAMVRQGVAERSEQVAARAPLLARALPWVAHQAIRNRGTIGGSLAHADPASELPAVMLALGASLTVAGPGGDRSVNAGAFFPGFFSTDLAEGEILREIVLAPPPPRTGWAFAEVARRHGDFALAGVATQVTLDGQDRVAEARVGLFGVGTGPVLSAPAAQALAGEAPSPERLTEAAGAAAEGLSPLTDVHASAEYRRHLAGVLVERTLAEAVAGARRAGRE